MPGQLRNVVLGALAATAVAGCGSDEGTIPSDNADTLLARLDAIESHIEEGACTEAQAQAETFKSDVNELPAPVDNEIKQGLQQSADQLLNLTSSDCAEPETGTTDIGGAVPAETTEPETSVPTTTETETTTEQETTPESELPPEAPGDGRGEGEGQGNPGGEGPSDGGVSPPSGGVNGGGNG